MKDRNRCAAHDTGGCQAGVQNLFGLGPDIPCATDTGYPGLCDTTTGNAGFCAASFGCRVCGKDADCRPFCGARAACLRCGGCESTGGTACASPTLGGCHFPP